MTLDINKIAEQASRLRNNQASKPALYDAMKDFINVYIPPEDADGLEILETRMTDLFAVIYKHCDGITKAKPKTPFNWVARAMGNDDVRTYLNYVYSTGEEIVATDGHRLHLYKTDKVPAGYYDRKAIKVHDTDYQQYPDYPRLINTIRNGRCTFNDFELINHPLNGDRPYPVYKLKDFGLNARYLDEALWPFPLENKPVFEHGEIRESLKISYGDYTALVMPLRLDRP